MIEGELGWRVSPALLP